ncbi:MAG: hypothetical protein R3C32_11615 [Chloroflexota bacterium]
MAASGPLSLLSLTGLTQQALLAAGLLAGLVSLPLGWSFADRLVEDARCRTACWLALTTATGAVLPGWRISSDGMGPDLAGASRWLLASATALLPAVILAGATLRSPDQAGSPAARRILRVAVRVGHGHRTRRDRSVPRHPGMRCWSCRRSRSGDAHRPDAARAQPLAGPAGAAQTQRDRVVVAADAERMRLARCSTTGRLPT